MIDLMNWAEIERAYEALPDLTEDQIAALPDEELERQAAIEFAYMTLVLVREGRADQTLEQIVVDHPAEFPPEAVEAARGRLGSVKAFVAAELPDLSDEEVAAGLGEALEQIVSDRRRAEQN